MSKQTAKQPTKKPTRKPALEPFTLDCVYTEKGRNGRWFYYWMAVPADRRKRGGRFTEKKSKSVFDTPQKAHQAAVREFRQFAAGKIDIPWDDVVDDS